MIVPLLAALILLGGGMPAFKLAAYWAGAGWIGAEGEDGDWAVAAPDARHSKADSPFSLLADGSPDSFCPPRPVLAKPVPIALKGGGTPEPCLPGDLAARTAPPTPGCGIGLLERAPPSQAGLTTSRLPTGPPRA